MADPHDPLHRLGEPRHVLELPVLGVPLAFEADDPRLLDHVREAFGAWRTLASRPELVEDRRLRLRLAVHDDHPGDAGRPEVRYRVPDARRLLLSTPGSLATADRDRGEGVAYVTPSLLEQGAHFRYGVLSALALFLATGRDRLAVHAAAVASGDRALLLHGPSGVGKSTLAWASHRAGLRVVAEDAVYVQLSPTLRVWGMPGPVHVSAEALRFFPDTEPGGSAIRAGGREKLVLPLPDPDPSRPPVAQVVGICLLERGEGPSTLEPAEPGAVERALERPDEPGFDLEAGERAGVLEAFRGTGAWRMRVGPDPTRAVELLRELLAPGPEAGPAAAGK